MTMRLAGVVPQEESLSLSLRLRQAALLGDVDLVRQLLRAGADPNYPHHTDARNLPDSNPGKTALHYAAWHGRWEVVDALLRAGARPNAARLSGDTPLREWVRGLSNASAGSGRDYHRCAVLLLQSGADPDFGHDAASGCAWQAARNKGVDHVLQGALDEVRAGSQARELQMLTGHGAGSGSVSRL